MLGAYATHAGKSAALVGEADFGGRKGLALVIDDDRDMRRFVKTALLAAGHRVVEAEALEIAFNLLQAHAPDIVVLDVNLPDGDGFAGEFPDHGANLGARVEAQAVVDGVDALITAEQAVSGLAIGVVDDEVERTHRSQRLVVAHLLVESEVMLLEVGVDAVPPIPLVPVPPVPTPPFPTPPVPMPVVVPLVLPPLPVPPTALPVLPVVVPPLPEAPPCEPTFSPHVQLSSPPPQPESAADVATPVATTPKFKRNSRRLSRLSFAMTPPNGPLRPAELNTFLSLCPDPSALSAAKNESVFALRGHYNGPLRVCKGQVSASVRALGQMKLGYGCTVAGSTVTRTLVIRHRRTFRVWTLAQAGLERSRNIAREAEHPFAARDGRSRCTVGWFNGDGDSRNRD